MLFGTRLASAEKAIKMNDIAANSTKDNPRNHFGTFHAGSFLRGLLQEQGHDAAWLAERTSHDVAFVEHLLEQPNMDAELFVRMGLPMDPLFMQRVHEMIFGTDPME